MATATFELGNVQIDKLTEPSGGSTSSFGDTIFAPGIDAYGSTVFNLATTNATAINIGHTGLSTYIYGASLLVNSSIDAITAGTLTIGDTVATGGRIGSISNTGNFVWNSTYSILYGPTQTGELAVGDANIYIQGAPTLNILTPTTIMTGDLTLGGDDAYSLGTFANRWKDGYFSQMLQVQNLEGSGYGNLNLGSNSANVFIGSSTPGCVVTFNAPIFGGISNDNFIPFTNNTYSLGNSSATWKDGYFGNTATANIDSGASDLTINANAQITANKFIVYGGIQATVPPSITWAAVTFTNSWLNTNVGLYNAASYYKDALGFVHLRGHVFSGTSTTSAFTLPAGYRPTAGALQFLRSTGAGALTCVVSVQASGNVVIIDGTGDTNADGASLEGICFYAEQ